MMMSPMERSTFNKLHNYRLVLASDIDLRHCGNCTHSRSNGCSLMAQCDIPLDETQVNRRRGLCDLWQIRKDK